MPTSEWQSFTAALCSTACWDALTFRAPCSLFSVVLPTLRSWSLPLRFFNPLHHTWSPPHMRFSLASVSSLALFSFFLFFLWHGCHKSSFEAQESWSPHHVIYRENAGIRAIAESRGRICGRYSKRRNQSQKLVSLINQNPYEVKFHPIFFLICKFEVM